MDGKLITFKNVSYCYPSGTLALDNMDLDIPKGKKIALLGANGAGKSTFILMLNGILKPSNGSIYYGDAPYSYRKKSLRSLRSKVGLVFQEPDNQLIAPTVYEEISFGLSNISSDQQSVRNQVEAIIKQFKLEAIQDKSPHQLSSGQKKMVSLASILVMKPDLVVCDEPTSSLDATHSDLTYEYLDCYQEQGHTVLISTHDTNQAYQWADFVIVLMKGKVLATGHPKQVFSKHNLFKKAGIRQPFILNMVRSIFPDIEPDQIPTNINALKTLLIPELCKDL